MNVTINGKDAKTTWGIEFDSSAISAIMTPPPMKSYIENESRLEHGKRLITSNAKVDARESVSLTFSLRAKSETQFFARYDSFCSELETPTLNIVLESRPSVTYKFVYKSCRQFTQYNNKLARFTLLVEEANPKDRS